MYMNVKIFLSLSPWLIQFSLGFEVGNNHAFPINGGKEFKMYSHPIFECMSDTFLGTHPVYQVHQIQVW